MHCFWFQPLNQGEQHPFSTTLNQQNDAVDKEWPGTNKPIELNGNTILKYV